MGNIIILDEGQVSSTVIVVENIKGEIYE